MIFKCRDKQIEYGKEPVIMGIINVTPDSFSDGGYYFDSDNAITHAQEMIDNEDVSILDFGAQSTRPGHTPVSADEEIKRLSDVIPAVRNLTDKVISVDTYYPEVAKRVIDWGADIINDVSGIVNSDMAEIVKTSGAGWIIMHSKSGSVDEVREFFDISTAEALALGVKKDKYKKEGYPLLLGTSRKRVIGEYSHQSDPLKRTYGNISADAFAILGGVDIIRIHDTENEIDGIKMAYALKCARG